MKKAAVILLVLAMLLSFAVNAFAAETVTITVNDERVYEVYQIFTGDLYGSTLSNIKWGVNGTGETGTDVDETTLNALAAVKSSSDTDKLAVIEAYANLESTPIGTVKKDNPLSVTTGYYLLRDTTEVGEGRERSTYVVEIVGPTTITAKAGEVHGDKKVKDNNDSIGTSSDWQDSASYDIGDDVPFKLSGTVSENYDNYDSYYYCFHDKLSAGLAFNNDVTVKIDGTKITTGYQVVCPATDGCSFDVQFTDLKTISAVHAGSTITVEYTAKLTGDAVVIGSTGNPNEMHIEYSNDPNSGDKGETPDDKVVVFTYKVVVDKVDGETDEPLKGAGFTLYKYDASIEGEDKWVQIGEEVKGTDLTTFVWKGLDDGTYKLVETTTPPGYNTMADIIFEVTSTYETSSADPKLITLTAGDFGRADVAAGTITEKIENNKGTVLPETGAKGTAMFAGFGTLAILIAVVFLVTRKKMSVYEE